MPGAAAKAENTYVVAPQSPGDHFPVRPAQEIMRKALAAGLNQGHVLEVRAAKQPSEPYSAELTKPLADSIRDKLKGACAAGAPSPAAHAPGQRRSARPFQRARFCAPVSPRPPGGNSSTSRI